MHSEFKINMLNCVLIRVINQKKLGRLIKILTYFVFNNCYNKAAFLEIINKLEAFFSPLKTKTCTSTRSRNIQESSQQQHHNVSSSKNFKK